MSNKIFIGKGKAQKFGVRVTLNLTKSEVFSYEHEGQKYLTFYLDEMRNPDQFGRTHAAHVLSFNQPEADSVPVIQMPLPAANPQPAKRRRKRTA